MDSGAASAETLELTASRAVDGLRRVLADDEAARKQLLEALQSLAALQAQLVEWSELHRILHRVLDAFSSFQASLRAPSHAGATPAERRALLRSWRPCQTEMDRLADFRNSVEHISLSPGSGGADHSGPDWSRRIASLRGGVEDALREEAWSIEGLIDLADELSQACTGYLNHTEWELRRAVAILQRSYTHLLGGLA